MLTMGVLNSWEKLLMKSLRRISVPPRPYAETLHDTAAWLKASGKLK